MGNYKFNAILNEPVIDLQGNIVPVVPETMP